MIRQCDNSEFDTIYEIINDAAQAYKGVIPADCWKEPYMSRDELQREMDKGVVFWGYDEDGELVGVMGIQHVKDVTLIRHAYVRSARCNQGGHRGKIVIPSSKADHSPDLNRHLGGCRLGDSFLWKAWFSIGFLGREGSVAEEILVDP